MSDSDMGEGESSLAEQLKEINQKLSNSLTRDDALLKQSHRIDILEGNLFEKEVQKGPQYGKHFRRFFYYFGIFNILIYL